MFVCENNNLGVVIVINKYKYILNVLARQSFKGMKRLRNYDLEFCYTAFKENIFNFVLNILN